MTNRQRINNLNNSEFLKEITKLVKIAGYSYVDWDKYFCSESPEIPYIGQEGEYKPCTDEYYTIVAGKPCEWEPCIVVNETSIFGTKYKAIIAKDQICKVPADRVRIFPKHGDSCDD